MALEWMRGIDDGSPIFATYFEAIVQALSRARYVVSGCVVSPGSGLTVNVGDGVINDGKTQISVSGTSISLDGEVSGHVRYDVIVYDISSGQFVVLKGGDFILTDSGYISKTARISDSHVPIAVVRVNGDVNSVSASDIFDVRVNGDYLANVDFARVDENIVPVSDNAFDLGLASKRWKDGYFAGTVSASEFVGSIDWGYVSNKPASYPPSAHSHSISDITDIGSASVAYATAAGDADTLDGLHASQFLRSDADGTLNGSLVVTGDLVVQGTTTTINAQEVNIGDNILTLNSDYTSGAPVQDAGIAIKRGDEPTVYLLWNEANDEWTVTEDGSNFFKIWHSGNVGPGSGLDADTVDGLEGSQLLRKDVADTKIGDLTLQGNLVPSSDNLYDLGSLTNRWRDLYLKDGIVFPIERSDSAGVINASGVIKWSGLTDKHSIFVEEYSGTGENTRLVILSRDNKNLDYLEIRQDDATDGEKVIAQFKWDNTYFNNNVLPLVDGSYDLGSGSARWKDGYFSGVVSASEFVGNVDWGNVVNKPSVFPPAAHTHTKADITDFAHSHDAGDIVSGRFSLSRLPTSSTANTVLVVRSANGDPVFDKVDWNTDIKNIPSEFPPAAHSHSISDITDLGSASVAYAASAGDADTLDGHHASDFALAGHTHSVANLSDTSISSPQAGNVLKFNGSGWVNGFVDWSEVVNKPDSFTPGAHTHSISDVAFDGNFVPVSDGVYDIGSGTSRVRSIFVKDIDVGGEVKITTSQRTTSVIKAVAGLDTNGDLIAFGSRGTTVIGSGAAWMSAITSLPQNIEHTYMISDHDVEIHVGQQNGWGTGVMAVKIDSTGTMNTNSVFPMSDNAYDLGSSTNRWRNMHVAGTLYLYNLVDLTSSM